MVTKHKDTGLFRASTQQRATRLQNLTAEERQAMAEKAQAAKKAKNAARKVSKLRRDFADADLWEDLARERKLRLPPWGEPPTMSNMRTWLHKVGWSQGQCEAWLGCPLRRFPELNPSWPLRSFAGLVLEEVSRDSTSA